MSSFGKIKTKILGKLSESYSSENKSEMKQILKTIKENKDFKELYLFYEEIENLELGQQDSAQLYVETVEPLLIKKTQSIKNICESLSKTLADVECEKNELYECLDVLSEESNLNNLDQKITAKKKLIDHLKLKKAIKKSEAESFTVNESLLYGVLANNFNVLYNNTLNEEQKNELKNILSLSTEELENNVPTLKEDILSRVTTMLNESSDNDLTNKLNSVVSEVKQMETSKYNYFRLKQLKDGLD